MKQSEDLMDVISQTIQGDILHASWANTAEPLSLGALLVFRQELELLAQHFNIKKICIRFQSQFKEKEKLIDLILSASAVSMKVEFVDQLQDLQSTWPHLLNNNPISYQSFARINLLWEEFSIKPVLNWNESALHKVKALKSSFKNHVVTVHLKQVGNDPTESNANLQTWHDFFVKIINENKELCFILLGNDVTSQKLGALKNVYYAAELQMSLSEQLAFISFSNGFMGMASGLCQAAIFSKVPYVIFKHPLHHVQEMKNEIGDKDHFVFSNEPQFFWRKPDTLQNLRDAFHLLGIL